MGQPIVVVEEPSATNPGIVRFVTNRALTGTGHERYEVGTEVRGDRPPDELARRLIAHGTVDAVHVNGNVVTVDLAKGHSSEGLAGIIEDLYIFYPDADEPEPDGSAPESEGEVVEATSAAPAEAAPDPVRPEPVDSEEAEAEQAEKAEQAAVETEQAATEAEQAETGAATD